MTLHCISGKNYETTRSDFILKAHIKNSSSLTCLSIILCCEVTWYVTWTIHLKILKWFSDNREEKASSSTIFVIYIYIYIYIYIFCNVFERDACASSLSRARPKIKHSQFFVGFLWKIIHYQKVWPDLGRLGTGTDVKVLRKAWDHGFSNFFWSY